MSNHNNFVISTSVLSTVSGIAARYNRKSEFFDIRTETLLCSFLKSNKTSTDNTINQHSKSLTYIFVMDNGMYIFPWFHLQGGQKSKPHIFVHFFAKWTIFNFFHRHVPW